MARAGQTQAKAVLQQARTALSYTRILAPFDGIVTEKKADVGALCQPRHAHLYRGGLHRRLARSHGSTKQDLRLCRMGQQIPCSMTPVGDNELEGTGGRDRSGGICSEPQLPG